MSWNLDGFNHIKVEFFLMDYSLGCCKNVQTTCTSHVDGVIYLHLYVLGDKGLVSWESLMRIKHLCVLIHISDDVKHVKTFQ